MAAKDPAAPHGRTRDGKPRKKTGPPKGVRPGGRARGTRNKATIEREKAAQLAADRARLKEEADKTGGAAGELMAAQAEGRKLMKDIGFTLTQLAMGLVAYYQPYATWVQAVDARGAPMFDKTGRPVLVNANPNFDEARFDKYFSFAMQGARDFASYESPKLAAVILAQDLVGEITVVGGLPDDEDGGLIDAPADFAGVTIDATAEELKPGAGGARHSGGGAPQGAGGGPVPPQSPG